MITKRGADLLRGEVRRSRDGHPAVQRWSSVRGAAPWLSQTPLSPISSHAIKHVVHEHIALSQNTQTQQQQQQQQQGITA